MYCINNCSYHSKFEKWRTGWHNKRCSDRVILYQFHLSKPHTVPNVDSHFILFFQNVLSLLGFLPLLFSQYNLSDRPQHTGTHKPRGKWKLRISLMSEKYRSNTKFKFHPFHLRFNARVLHFSNPLSPLVIATYSLHDWSTEKRGTSSDQDRPKK